MDIELGGDVYAEISRDYRRHDHDADIQVGDLETGGVVVQLQRLVGVYPSIAVVGNIACHLMIAVEIRPVGPIGADEGRHICRTDGHGRDCLVRRIVDRRVRQCHFLGRPQFKGDTAGEEYGIEEIEFDEALGTDQR